MSHHAQPPCVPPPLHDHQVEPHEGGRKTHGYRRTLELDQGVSTVKFSAGGVHLPCTSPASPLHLACTD